MAKGKAKVDAFVRIDLDKEGNMKIDTNMSGLGAIHLLASAQQVIVERSVEAQVSEETSEEESH